MSRHIWASISSGVIALVMGCGGWVWLWQPVESPAVSITAALDVVERGLPVWAQFDMTQTLFMAEPVRVTKVTVPIYFPAGATEPLVVELWRYDTLISRWRYSPEKFGTVSLVDLPVEPAQLLDGKMSVHFQASGIAHDQKEVAPRLFVESADAYYPAGNYYVAENAKHGDIALTIYSQTTNLDLLLRELQEKPLQTHTVVSRWLVLAVVILIAPYPITRLWGPVPLVD